MCVVACMQSRTHLKKINHPTVVKDMIKIDKIKGKKVIAKNGMLIGKVEDIELDENNWTVTVEVKVEDSIEKLYGEKSGFMKKSIMPLPAALMGPIGEDSIYLNEKITDVESLRAQIETKRAIF
jgi:sporulation protein YlmC with PRC-barrel domain